MPCDACDLNDHPPFHVVTTTTGSKRDVAVYCSKCLTLPGKDGYPLTDALVRKYPTELEIDPFAGKVVIEVPIETFEEMLQSGADVFVASGSIRIQDRIPF